METKMIDGKQLEISPASFGECMGLIKALADAVKGDGIRFDMTNFKISFDNMEDMKFGDVGGIMDAALSVISDEKLRGALFSCAGRCMFNKEKIDEALFERVENRALYFPIMAEILKVNLSPFLGKLNSSSMAPGSLIEKLLGRKSEQK